MLLSTHCFQFSYCWSNTQDPCRACNKPSSGHSRAWAGLSPGPSLTWLQGQQQGHEGECRVLGVSGQSGRSSQPTHCGIPLTPMYTGSASVHPNELLGPCGLRFVSAHLAIIGQRQWDDMVEGSRGSQGKQSQPACLALTCLARLRLPGRCPLRHLGFQVPAHMHGGRNER